MHEQIAKVEYKWGTRYWCFDDGLVVDAYDECGSTVTRNKMLAKGFDDMTLDELISACTNQYNVTIYTGDKADDLLYEICTRLDK